MSPSHPSRWFFTRAARRPGALLQAAVLCVVAAPRSALGQEVDEQLRRELLTQAEQARAEGNHARAIDLGTRAAQLRASPSVGLMLAQEHEALGHLTAALGHAQRCAAEAATDATLRNREQIAGACSGLVRALEGRVARLTVQVPVGLAEGTSVQVATRPLPAAAWGVALPVDPGELVVRASTADGRRFERSVRVAEGASANVVVAFAPSAQASVAPPAPTPGAPQAGAGADAPRASVGAGPWILAGAGVLAFGAAGLFWGLHGGALSERDAACDAGGCDPSSVDADTRARTLTTVTNVSLAAGGAAIAGGLVWFFVARARSSPPAVRPTAWASPTGGGVALGGTL